MVIVKQFGDEFARNEDSCLGEGVELVSVSDRQEQPQYASRIWWRRRESNPRPRPSYQPRLHA